MDWYGIFKSALRGWFELVWFVSKWIDSEHFRFQITEFLRPKSSTWELFLRSAFSIFFASKVFNFTFHCDMPLRSALGNIWRHVDWVGNIAVVCSIRIWDRSHVGSLWVHPSAVINIPPGSGNINTNIQTPYGEVVLITVYRSGSLFEMEYG